MAIIYVKARRKCDECIRKLPSITLYRLIIVVGILIVVVNIIIVVVFLVIILIIVVKFIIFVVFVFVISTVVANVVIFEVVVVDVDVPISIRGTIWSPMCHCQIPSVTHHYFLCMYIHIFVSAHTLEDE